MALVGCGGIFLSIKRKFGEDLRTRSVIGLLTEAM